jgi:hypothetical protein
VTDASSGSERPIAPPPHGGGVPSDGPKEADLETRGYYRRPLRDRIVHGDSYVLVFVFIVVAYFCTSLLPPLGWTGLLIVVVNSVTVLTALRTSWARPTTILVARIAVALSVVAAAVAVLLANPGDARGYLLPIGFMLWMVTAGSIGRRIISHKVITYETLAGAVDVYLLIGLIFSSVYRMIETYSGTPFFVQVADPTPNQYLYFSYVTLATLGYGDLTPATNIGRTVVVIEAILGQVYLVTAVARLVSLLGVRRD